MLLDIYKSDKNDNKFLFVPTGTDLKKWIVPAGFDRELVELSFYERLDITANDRRIGIDSADIVNRVLKKGYATHEVKENFALKFSLKMNAVVDSIANLFGNRHDDTKAGVR